MITVGDIMTPHPITLPPDAGIQQAREVCKQHGIRHIPVVDENNTLVGLVSDRDIFRASESSLLKLSSKQRLEQDIGFHLQDFMTTSLHIITSHASIEVAARHIEKLKIGCLPVVDHGKLVGIITDSDFVGVAITLMELMAEQTPDNEP
jgi:CBS domain-containing protein